VRIPDNDDEIYYGIAILDETPLVSRIPKDSCFVCSSDTSPKKRVATFVQTLRSWADDAEGIVPYLWCGHSFTGKIKDEGYTIERGMFFGRSTQYWARKNMNVFPAAGLNCATSVLRAALACGIPYFYRTTDQLFRNRDNICMPRGGTIRNGFVMIYMGDVHPGRVLVVSDVENNEAVSAAGYEYTTHGGKMRRYKLDELFENVRTYKDFEKLYAQGDHFILKHFRPGATRVVREFRIFDIYRLFSRN